MLRLPANRRHVAYSTDCGALWLIVLILYVRCYVNRSGDGQAKTHLRWVMPHHHSPTCQCNENNMLKVASQMDFCRLKIIQFSATSQMTN